MSSQNSEASPTLILVGRVGSVHGIKGAVKVHSHTEPKQQILKYHPWRLKINQQWHTLNIKSSHIHGQMLIVQFEGYTDRDQARLLTGAEIAVERTTLPELSEGEFYWSDLIGLSVFTEAGVDLGAVTSLIETGSNDVLVVKKDKKERLIPYLPERFIKNIDLKAKRMIVDWDPEF